MRELLNDAAERALRYLEAQPERPIAPTAAAIERLAELDIALPAGSCDPAETLAILDAHSEATLAVGNPRFYGFVIGGALPVSIAANWLATAWDQNAGMVALSPISARLEEVAGHWLVDLLALPAETGVGFVTGATTANFTGLLELVMNSISSE